MKPALRGGDSMGNGRGVNSTPFLIYLAGMLQQEVGTLALCSPSSCIPRVQPLKGPCPRDVQSLAC